MVFQTELTMIFPQKVYKYMRGSSASINILPLAESLQEKDTVESLWIFSRQEHTVESESEL